VDEEDEYMKLPPQILNQDTINHIQINPGEFFVSQDKDIVISTLLGSCVAACLYDPINEVLGMNHFLLSSNLPATSDPICISQAGRYGVHAMELLINDMLKQGASRCNLKAKAFGGANILNFNLNSKFTSVGEVNACFVKEFLKNERIPLVGSDLHGKNGLVIHFTSSDYGVFKRKIRKSNAEAIEKREFNYWKEESLQQNNQKRDDSSLF